MGGRGQLGRIAVLAVFAAPFAIVLSPLVLAWAWHQARGRREAGYKKLWPLTARTLERYAEAMIRGEPPPEGWNEVARHVDTYLAAGHAPRIWRVQALVVLMEVAPILKGRPPFSWLGLEARKAFVDRYLIEGRGLMRLVSMGRQVVRLGYYSSQAAHEHMGFVPVGERLRERALKRKAAVAKRRKAEASLLEHVS